MRRIRDLFWLIVRYLAQEAGQVPADTEGDTAQDAQDADQQEELPLTDTGTDTEGATQEEPAEKPKEPESFINPADLPEELKPHWSRMHRAYTKALEKTKEFKTNAGLVEKFYNDQTFALQTVNEWAKQNGYQVSPLGAGQAQGQTQTQPQVQIPPQMVDAVKQTLPPELQWMAEGQARSIYTAMQMMLAPLVDQQRKGQQSQIAAQYDEMAEQLSNTAPGWEEHEDEMLELDKYLRSDALTHKRYGSKVALLYNLVTGNAHAISEASKRMTKAVKNRASSNSVTSRTTSNIAERVRKATSDQEAFRVAAGGAMDSDEN